MDVLTQLAPSVFPVTNGNGGVVGTGFFFSRHGWALTALHVVAKEGRAARLGEKELLVDLDNSHRSVEHDAIAVRVDGAIKVEPVEVDTHWLPVRTEPIVAASHQEHGRFADPVPLILRCEGEVAVRALEVARLTLSSLPTAAYRPKESASGSPLAVNRSFQGRPPRVVGMFQGGWRPKSLNDRDAIRVDFGLSLARLASIWPFITNVGYRGPPIVDPPPPPDEVKPFLPVEGHPDIVMSVRHVTVDDYNGYLADTAGAEPIEGACDFPVTGVSPADAERYANWLGQRLGSRCRLPTYDEWLAAAQAGRGDAWLFDDIRRHSVNYHDTIREIWPAGYLAPNPWGFLDMAGNVWDICSTSEGEGYILAGGWAGSVRGELAGKKRIRPRSAPKSAGFRCVCEAGGE